MNKVMITVATLILASSLSYFSMSDTGNIESFRELPPPAPPVEAQVGSDEEKVEDSSGRAGCLACGGSVDGRR
ncbi:MAG: hypothetical protein ACJ74W_20005 [Pyrinomonadaceae bacterium]